jgi:hypothetical protein
MSRASGEPRREPLAVTCWKWGTLFSARHVNVLRAMLARHLHVDHRLICVSDDPTGLDGDIVAVSMPDTYVDTPRCRRRMQQWSREWSAPFGPRMLAIDLDVVIVDDITPIVDRHEPIVGWKVGHAGVYSGSFLLADVGALDGAWQRFAADPVGYPAGLQPRGVASDQAMLNAWLASQPAIAEWTEADGFVSYYGAGYERLEHLGVGPTRRDLPPGARIVVLGSADLEVLESGQFTWADEHWVRVRDEVAA